MSKNNKNNAYYIKRFNIEQVLSLRIIMGTVAGITVPFYIQSFNQISAIREDVFNQISAIREDVRSIQEDVRAIHNEMRDFHGRLCAIEERNRK